MVTRGNPHGFSQQGSRPQFPASQPGNHLSQVRRVITGEGPFRIGEHPGRREASNHGDHSEQCRHALRDGQVRVILVEVEQAPQGESAGYGNQKGRHCHDDLLKSEEPSQQGAAEADDETAGERRHVFRDPKVDELQPDGIARNRDRSGGHRGA